MAVTVPRSRYFHRREAQCASAAQVKRTGNSRTTQRCVDDNGLVCAGQLAHRLWDIRVYCRQLDLRFREGILVENGVERLARESRFALPDHGVQAPIGEGVQVEHEPGRHRDRNTDAQIINIERDKGKWLRYLPRCEGGEPPLHERLFGDERITLHRTKKFVPRQPVLN